MRARQARQARRQTTQKTIEHHLGARPIDCLLRHRADTTPVTASTNNPVHSAHPAYSFSPPCRSPPPPRGGGYSPPPEALCLLVLLQKHIQRFDGAPRGERQALHIPTRRERAGAAEPRGRASGECDGRLRQLSHAGGKEVLAIVVAFGDDAKVKSNGVVAIPAEESGRPIVALVTRPTGIGTHVPLGTVQCQ